MFCGGVEPSWPICLSHMSILLERSHLCSLSHCDIFSPLLCVSPYSPPDLWLFLPDSTISTILILHSRDSCHSHPFHTSHLSIFALFLSLTSTSLTGSISLPSSPKSTSTPFQSALKCILCPPSPTASDSTAYLTRGFPCPPSALPSSGSLGGHEAIRKGSALSERNQPDLDPLPRVSQRERCFGWVPPFGGRNWGPQAMGFGFLGWDLLPSLPVSHSFQIAQGTLC